MCPCRAFYKYECVLFFLKMFLSLFFAGNAGSLRTKISQKIQKPEYLAKTNKRKIKNTRKRLGTGTLNTCAKFQGSVSQKRRGHWTLKEIGVLRLNQPMVHAQQGVPPQ